MWAIMEQIQIIQLNKNTFSNYQDVCRLNMTPQHLLGYPAKPEVCRLRSFI